MSFPDGYTWTYTPIFEGNEQGLPILSTVSLSSFATAILMLATLSLESCSSVGRHSEANTSHDILPSVRKDSHCFTYLNGVCVCVCVCVCMCVCMLCVWRGCEYTSGVCNYMQLCTYSTSVAQLIGMLCIYPAPPHCILSLIPIGVCLRHA